MAASSTVRRMKSASWVDDLPNPDRIPDALRQGAIQLRQGLADIIQAGANGDL